MGEFEVRGDHGSKSPHATVSQAAYEARVYQSKPRLERYLNSFSTIAFATIMLVSWEGLSSSLMAGLYNGGPAAIVYGMIVASIGAIAMTGSLGELASILPVAGAQYHWTYELAPFAPRFFSFVQGWITVFAWISTIAVIPFLIGTQIQGIIILNKEHYVPSQWHGTLLMWAVMIIPLLVNVFTRTLLPAIEVLGGTMHILAWPGIIITLVMLAPRHSSEFVWNTFVYGLSGWEDPGVVWSIGMLTVISTLNGYDGVIHMAEEVKNSRQVIPRAMLCGVFINALFAIGFAITIIYTMGSLEDALNSPTDYPIIGIYKQATQSNHAASAMLAFVGLPGFIALFNGLASVTRLTWSFARDNGLPFSDFFLKISPTYRIPLRCLWLVSAVVLLLSLINIGSSAAFNAILSLSAIALYFSYLVPIVFLVIKRIRAPHEIQWGPFCLGKWGLPINIFSIIWAVYILIFLPFPPTLPVTAENMNYAAPVFIGVVLFAVVDWCFRGRFKWNGPIGKMAIE